MEDNVGVSLLFTWYDSGGARGFSKILDNLAESRFLV